MGELRDLMISDYYGKFVFLTDKQKGEGFYERARALSEDLVFLKILLRRNSISGFGFEITPMCSTMDFRLWHDLFHCSFGGHTEEDYIRKLLVDYYLIENLFVFLSGEKIESENAWSMDTCAAVKNYFASMHGLNVENYVGCFINCSGRCEDVFKIVHEL